SSHMRQASLPLALIASFTVSLGASAESPTASGGRLSAASEQAAYLQALRARMTGAPNCYPDNLSDAEKAAVIASTGALPPPLMFLDPERLFTSSTVWTGNGLQGSSGQAAPAQLTYSFPEDGTTWGISPRPVVPNDLNSALGHVFGGANPDLGHEYLRQCLAGWRKTSSLTYTEVADNNSAQDSNTNRVSTRGDARIGAGFSWPDTYLAYNFFPSGGSDMFFNSYYWEGNFLSRPNDSYRYLRNTASHEHGHGLGFIHAVPCNQIVLMEPFLSVAFDQQQIDDLRNVQRNYGDRFAGNNSAANARDFGTLTGPTRSVIERLLSTNGSSGPSNTNQDWFKFTLGSAQNITITVTPVGGSYVNGQQLSGCAGSTATVNADQAGDLAVQLRNSDGSTVILNSTGGGLGIAEVISSPSRPAGTYTVRVIDNGPNDPVNQVLQLYDLEIRVGTSKAPPIAIAGVNKRIMAGLTCYFLGDIHSYATDTGATLSTFEWDLDGDGSYEVANDPRPSTIYSTPGVRNVRLRVTDSNGMSATDTIAVTVYSAVTSVNAVSPYPFRNTQGTSVPITIYGTGLGSVTTASQVTCSGTGTTVTGTPVVNGAGTQITGLSIAVAPFAPKGPRVVTVNAPGGTGRASFYLYPPDSGPFSITSPTVGSTTPDSSPEITWSPSAWSVYYFPQIAADELFNNIVLSGPTTLSSTAWQVPPGILTPGTTYWVRVRALNESGLAVWAPTVSFIAGAASGSNNNCSNAFVVTDGQRAFTNINSDTDGPNEPDCASGGYSAMENDVWFSYNAACNGLLTVSLCPATFDSMLAVYAGGCPGSGTLVECNDDFCDTASQVSFNAISGTNYRIRASGWQGATGYGTLTVVCVPVCPGDANGDGIIGLADIAVLIQHWTQSVLPGTNGDVSGNGSVGLDDVAIVIQHWNQSCN
ncbi:MAG TPA: PKD domain-containing protein, partial [Phycisphaerales bacterium]|nr:PKD domain-containing protein [Phycisphaerales bacterium]